MFNIFSPFLNRLRVEDLSSVLTALLHVYTLMSNICILSSVEYNIMIKVSSYLKNSIAPPFR